MQTKLIITTAALLGLAAPAHARPFHPTARDFTISYGNSPGSGTDTVTFSPGTTQLIDGGNLALTISVVAAGGGAEWAVFTYQTVNADLPLSTSGENWSISQTGIPAAVALNFIWRLYPMAGAGRSEYSADRRYFRPDADGQPRSWPDRLGRRHVRVRQSHWRTGAAAEPRRLRRPLQHRVERPSGGSGQWLHPGFGVLGPERGAGTFDLGDDACGVRGARAHEPAWIPKERSARCVGERKGRPGHAPLIGAIGEANPPTRYPAASLNLAAAASGVISRWGDPSISKPTMNFRMVAERRSGG